MKIDKPATELIRNMFKEYDSAATPREKAFKAMEMVEFFHKHYMEKIEIILAIAGEMQKHFKEN